MNHTVPYNVRYSAQSFWVLAATPIDIGLDTLFCYTRVPLASTQ
jgi:hypothetical protein